MVSRLPLVAGFDIGGTNVRGVLLDRTGTAVGEDRVARPDDPESLVSSVVTLVERLGDAAGESVQASVEVALREHRRDVLGLVEQVAGGLEVAGEEASGLQSGGDHLSVGHGVLRVFSMADGIEKVINEAVDCDNGDFHGQDVVGVKCGSLPLEHRAWGSPFSTICP